MGIVPFSSLAQQRRDNSSKFYCQFLEYPA